MDSGHQIKVVDAVYASITSGKKEEAHKWLRDNGHEELIKNEITANLGKDSDDISEKAVEFFTDIGVGYSISENVHASTLKSFVKEQLKEGVNFPQDIFSVFQFRTTKIKNKSK